MKLGALKTAVLILMAASLLVAFGCGSKKESKGEEAVGVEYVTLFVCYNCHADANNPAGLDVAFGDSANAVEGWLKGPHGNYESINSQHQYIDQGPDNTGFPDYGYFSDDTCQTCHDQRGDGKLLRDFFLDTGITALGRVNRPVIACESCHGAGGNHYGVGPLKYMAANPGMCYDCHSSRFPDAHRTYHPEGDDIYENYMNSPHAQSFGEAQDVEGDPTAARARCSRCHTDAGAKRYIKIASGTLGYSALRTAMDGASDIEDASSVQCATCHNGHNPLELLGALDTAAPGTWSEQFKTCTSCHQLLKADGSISREAYHDPAVNSHGAFEEIITDTHYDDPATADVEGYIIDPTLSHSGNGTGNQGTCLDCHNPHSADNSINNDWASSAHGGHILEVKEADPNGAVSPEEAAAWTEYDFKGANRASCQRCHTSTGFRNFAADPANYDPANNVFIATGEQREMLYCWACHTSYMGAIRDPGPMADTLPYDAPAGRVEAVPDLGGSNVCLSCHSGRNGGQRIKDFTGSLVGTNFNTFYEHYLLAGGVLFRTIGYEYDGRDYENVSYFAHDKIGTEDEPGTGSNGPCVGCHMGNSDSHLFSPVSKDANGHVSEITSNSQTCSVCHSGEHVLTAAELNEVEEEFEAAKHALDNLLASKGIYYNHDKGRPYFFNTPDPALQATATAYTNWANKDTVGAASNLYVLDHDPGAYAHNRYYTKRLLYDSIDYLDDGVLNSSVEATLGSGAAYDYLKGVRPQ